MPQSAVHTRLVILAFFSQPAFAPPLGRRASKQDIKEWARLNWPGKILISGGMLTNRPWFNGCFSSVYKMISFSHGPFNFGTPRAWLISLASFGTLWLQSEESEDAELFLRRHGLIFETLLFLGPVHRGQRPGTQCARSLILLEKWGVKTFKCWQCSHNI